MSKHPDPEEVETQGILRTTANMLAGMGVSLAGQDAANREKLEKGRADHERYLRWKRDNPPPAPLPTERERRRYAMAGLKRVARIEGRDGDAAWREKIAAIVDDASKAFEELEQLEDSDLPDPVLVFNAAVMPTAKAIAKLLPDAFESLDEARIWCGEYLPCAKARAAKSTAEHAQFQRHRTSRDLRRRFWEAAGRCARLHYSAIKGDNLCLEQLVRDGENE